MPGPRVEESANVLSILSPEEVRRFGGLPNEAIVGVFADQSASLAAFRPNPRFLAFLHRVIAVAGPNDPELVSAAASQGTGWVYLIDGRTPEGPEGRVSPEDIVGVFKVEEGKLVEGGYQANDAYRAFTDNGIVQLPSSLRDKVLQALRDVMQGRRSSESPR